MFSIQNVKNLNCLHTFGFLYGGRKVLFLVKSLWHKCHS